MKCFLPLTIFVHDAVMLLHLSWFQISWTIQSPLHVLYKYKEAETLPVFRLCNNAWTMIRDLFFVFIIQKDILKVYTDL